MSTAFLSPRPSAEVTARSPLLDAALGAGATTEVHDGWEVPASFGDAAAEAAACREAVGFADASQQTKLELQGAGSAEFSPGRAERGAGGWRCPVRRTRELLLFEPAAATEAWAVAERAEASVCDLTASLAAIVVAGPAARDLFARFCALDLREASMPVHGFRPGSIARTPGFVLREAPQRFLMLFGAAQGFYMWDVVADAATRLGGRPVGVDALPPIAEEGPADA